MGADSSAGRSPQDKLVALPVKDPFHILRDFIKVVELYEKEGKAE